MAHARLRAEMDHLGKTAIREQCGHAAAVRQVKLVKLKFVVAREFRETSLLELRIVIGVEIIDADDVAPVLDQAPRNVKADKTGGPGDQNRRSRHGRKSFQFGSMSPQRGCRTFRRSASSLLHGPYRCYRFCRPRVAQRPGVAGANGAGYG